MGRNGALVFDRQVFSDVTVKYRAFIRREFRERFDALREFLMAKTGYRRLEDSYHPEEFRMAVFAGPLEPDVRALSQSGEFDML